MQRIFYLIGFFIIILVSCQENIDSAEKNATVDEPIIITEDVFKSIAEMDNAKTYLVDTSKSRVAWRCENHKGLVDINVGRIFIRKDELVGAYVEGLTSSARDTSITYKLMQGTFNNVLQTADFFDATHYPLLKFSTSDIQEVSNQYTIQGEVSIRNIIKPIRFNLDSYQKNDNNIAIVSEEIPINRTMFGMELNSRSFPDKAKDFIFSDTFFVKVVLFAEAL